MPPRTSAAVSLGDVASSILDAALTSNDAAVPILARRRGPEKRIAEAKAEEREAAAVHRAKRALSGQSHQTLRGPASHDPVLEKMLKKTATNGVVALFNAVRSAQKDDPVRSKDRKRRRVDESGSSESVEPQEQRLPWRTRFHVDARGGRGSAPTIHGQAPRHTALEAVK